MVANQSQKRDAPFHREVEKLSYVKRTSINPVPGGINYVTVFLDCEVAAQQDDRLEELAIESGCTNSDYDSMRNALVLTFDAGEYNR